MEAYQERVIEEANELGQKIIKLATFLFDGNSKVDYCTRCDLERQKGHMEQYYVSLFDRISGFEEE